MAKTKPRAKNDWRKGMPSPNPLGGKLHNKDMIEVRSLTRQHVAQVITDLLNSIESDLDAVAKDPNTPFMRKWLVKGCLNSFRQNDLHTLMKLLELVIGKVPDKIDHEYTLIIEKIKQVMELDKAQMIERAQSAIEVLKSE